MQRALASADRGVAALRSLRYTFKDARGVDRPCEVVRRFRKWGWRRGLPHRLRTYASGFEKTLPRSRLGRVSMFGFGLLQTLLGISLLSFNLTLRGAGYLYGVVATGIITWSGVSMVLAARRRHGKLEDITPEALILLTTDAGFCPGCLYDLSAAPRQGDGVCVCPECGGAWRMGVAWQR